MMDFIAYLLSHLSMMLQSDDSSMIPLHLLPQFETLYDGLRFLRTLLRKFPKMFHGEMRDTTRAVICNAGVIIFSIHQKDLVVDVELQDLVGCIKVIQSEFEVKKLNFPGTTVMAFLDTLLDYLKGVNRKKIGSNVMTYVPKIQEDIALLISIMGIFLELRKHQEDLCEDLWNLGIEVAYKLEFLVDQMVLGTIQQSFSASFQSIEADMKIIRTDALKIFDDKGLEKNRDIKIAAGIIISIQPVLDHLEFCINKSGFKTIESAEMNAAVAVICRLRCLRTFVICSTKLGINMELRSFWVRLDHVVRRILDDRFSRDSACEDAKRFLDNMEYFEDEMDKWFISLSKCCLQQSTPVVAVVDDLIGSVVENFEDFLMRFGSDESIESLKEYMVFLRNFISFSTLLSGDQHEEVGDLFSQIEGLAVSAAHLTLYIFADEDEDDDRMESISCALQLRIKPSHNPQLYGTYCRALASLKHSRELYASSLQDPLIVMMNFIGNLLSILMDMREPAAPFVNPLLESQLNTLYDGLKSLEAFLKRLPSMFHGKIMDIARVAVCDAGVLIFSFYQKDFVIDLGLEEFLGNIEVIKSEFEEKNLQISPNSTELAFLDTILHKSYKIHSNTTQRLEPTIHLDLVFLRSLMVKLVELREKQEDLHQALWILVIKVANKFEFLVHQLLHYRKIKDVEALSYLFLSIAADMNIIKTDSFKVNHHKTIVEVEDGDFEMASKRIISIQLAYDHVQSFFDMDGSGNDRPRIVTMSVMNRLSCLRTFVLCSLKLSNNVQLRSLLARLDGVFSEILDCEFSPYYAVRKSVWFIDQLEPLNQEIDKWYISLSYYNMKQCSSSSMATRIKDILDSLYENLEDFQKFPKSSELGVFEERIDTLKESITFLKSFITFASLMCAEQHQEARDIFTQIEAFAVSAAHLTMFFYTRCERVATHRMDSVTSILQLMIPPFQNLQFYAPAPHTKGNPLIAMMDSLLSLLWNMLLSDVALVVPSQSQLEKLDSGLRSLKGLLRKHPNKFDEETMDMVRLAVCHAGLIFSRDQEYFLIDHGIQEFQVMLKNVEDKVVPTSTFNFPRTIMLGFVDFLVEYMTEVDSSMFDSETLKCVSKIQEDIVFLKLLMGKLVELRDQQGNLHQALWDLGAATAYKMEFIIDQLLLGDIADSFSASVQSITKNMRSIRIESVAVFNVWREEINVLEITEASIDQVASQSSMPAFHDFVGFKPEQSSIMNRLENGWKTLQVVAIVGMPGLGKTTLATKVYNEISVVYRFHVRAWCSVSQVFNKRKVLVELLYHIQRRPPNEYEAKTVDDLAAEFRRCLKGRRYLIFLDDVWDMEAYNWLKAALPDDSTASRIILTTRHRDVATELDKEPVFLPIFSREESFELLSGKVFPDQNDWPSEIQDLGLQIAESCKGLPLTIVIVAGLLKTVKQELWTNVLKILKSGDISNADHCGSTIELSYNYLPDQLKRCFLSFAAFPEDHEISVKRLIWMWIAEGFVRKRDSERLEELARECLDKLIGRSLLVLVKETSMGSGAKACRMHDVLRDFCKKKASEESYMHQLQGQEDVSSFDDPGNIRRLYVLSEPKHFKKSKMYWPCLRSLLFWGKEEDSSSGYDMSFIFRIFKLVRVLDMERVYLSHEPPSEIGFLVHLRYLAIQVGSDVNPSIGNLCNLETFILHLARDTSVRLPSTFWNLQKLRHLYSVNGLGYHGITLPVDDLESSCNLQNLDSLSTLMSEDWDILEKLLRKFPNIRQLNCKKLCGVSVQSQAMSFSFPCHCLETLSLSLDPRSTNEYDRYEITFPNTIKKLTLRRCQWSSGRLYSGIAGLPNLEVLKLRSFLTGEAWHVEEGEFPKLRVLELMWVEDIVNWTSSDDQFRNLEKLVLNYCPRLEGIPECLETVDTLKLIEVTDCCDSVDRSVRKVEESQQDFGNSVLRVDVRHSGPGQ